MKNTADDYVELKTIDFGVFWGQYDWVDNVRPVNIKRSLKYDYSQGKPGDSF